MDTQVDLHSKSALYMGIELGSKSWKLAMSAGDKIREVNVTYADEDRLHQQVARAKERLGLAAAAPVCSCYEAGRDGFWIHRLLEKAGIRNMVIDPASVEVNRRKRRAKTDRIDAKKLVMVLMRYYQLGETTHCKVVRVPSEADEDARRPHRELERLKKERTQHTNRIRGLLAVHGIKVKNVRRVPWDNVRDWDGKSLGADLIRELKRECGRLNLVDQQIAQLEGERDDALKNVETKAEKVAAKLNGLKAVGPVSAWTMSHEFFAWRDFKNVREVGGLSGLTGTPYDSGQSSREQGISKAGNPRIRRVAIELAWSWVRYQPDSELAQWWRERFAHGNTRMRKVGITAVARKLLVALWKYIEMDELPAGAALKA
jgi:transposase